MPEFQFVSTCVVPASNVDAHSHGKIATLFFLNQQVSIKLLFSINEIGFPHKKMR